MEDKITIDGVTFYTDELHLPIFLVEERLDEDDIVRSYTAIRMEGNKDEKLIRTYTLGELLRLVCAKGTDEYTDCNQTQLESLREELDEI